LELKEVYTSLGEIINMKPVHQKKVKLAVKTRQTKWAPFWAVIRRFGKGKRMHPSRIEDIGEEQSLRLNQEEHLNHIQDN
jgi:hypothetical protein